MDMKRILSLGALALMIGAGLAACTPVEKDTVAKAVIPSASVMQFEAVGAAPQTITVYSDGDWVADSPSWITLSQTSGSGTVEGVSVSVADNKDGQGLLAPRRDTIAIHGNRLISYSYIIVVQNGDKYRGAADATVSTLASVKDGQFVNFGGAQVVAYDGTNAVLSDGKALLVMALKQDITVGDVISFKGVKETKNNVPVVSDLEGFSVDSHSAVNYPDATDITALIDGVTYTDPAFVTVSGVYDGSALSVEGATKSVAPTALAEMGLAGLVGNKLVLTGYLIGEKGNNLNMVLTAIKDNGPAVVPRPDKLLRAKWRFTTGLMSGYADLFGGTSGAVSQAEGFSDLYVPANVEGSGKITYYQVDKNGYSPTSGNPKRIVGGTGHPYVTGAWPGDYWLFSATDNYEYPAGTNLHIKFLTRISATGQKYWMLEYFDGAEWKPAEEYPVETESETGLNVKYNFIEPTSNVVVESSWTLAAPCREPMFRMRCVANWQSNGKGALANPNGGTCRIADNDDDGEDAGPVLEVTDAPEGGGPGPGGDVKPGTVLFEDDFEWIAPWATAASAGDAVKDNDPSTTAPNVFTSAACDGFLVEFVTRGYGYFEGKKDLPWTEVTAENIPGKVLYLQKNYLKFGKSDWNSGITLPAMSSIKGTVNAAITFDWCWQVTGAYKADLMTLTVEIVGNGTCAESSDALSPAIESAQIRTDGESKIEWQHASVTLNGIDKDTRIKIRPTNNNPYVENPERGQNRWYLDNIKVTAM